MVNIEPPPERFALEVRPPATASPLPAPGSTPAVWPLTFGACRTLHVAHSEYRTSATAEKRAMLQLRGPATTAWAWTGRPSAARARAAPQADRCKGRHAAVVPQPMASGAIQVRWVRQGPGPGVVPPVGGRDGLGPGTRQDGLVTSDSRQPRSAPLLAVDPSQRRERRVAVVTGANKGIGRHIARQLAQRGLLVLLGSRDKSRGQAAVAELVEEGLDVRLLQLDVTDPRSAAVAAGQVAHDPGRVDVLVNNAGITSGLDAASQMTLDDLRRTYETNVFGVVTVTNAFLPLLRRSPAPRIVNVSSGLGSLTMINDPAFPFADLNNAAYQSSKTALNALTVLYAKELRATGIKVNAVSPGYRATDLNGGLPTPGAGDPAEGAAVAVRLALVGEDGPTGEFHSHNGTTYPW